MADDIIVVVDEEQPINVTVETVAPSETVVEIQDVGLVGPPGPQGLPGDVAGEIELDAHVNSLTPHPVYDDGPSLSLLYENVKV